MPADLFDPAPLNPNAAPLHAPDAIAPEVSVPIPGVPQVPGAIPLASGFGVPGFTRGEGLAAIAAPPPQAPREPVRAGGKVEYPTRITYVPPVYPPIAVSARMEGTVTVAFTLK